MKFHRIIIRLFLYISIGSIAHSGVEAEEAPLTAASVTLETNKKYVRNSIRTCWSFLKQTSAAWALFYTKQALFNLFDTSRIADQYSLDTVGINSYITNYLQSSARYHVLLKGALSLSAEIGTFGIAIDKIAHIASADNSTTAACATDNEITQGYAITLGWFLAHLTPKPRCIARLIKKYLTEQEKKKFYEQLTVLNEIAHNIRQETHTHRQNEYRSAANTEAFNRAIFAQQIAPQRRLPSPNASPVEHIITSFLTTERCLLCNEPAPYPTHLTTPCGHTFHRTCLREYVRTLNVTGQAGSYAGLLGYLFETAQLYEQFAAEEFKSACPHCRASMGTFAHTLRTS